MEGSPGDIHPISRDPLRFDLPQMFAAHIDARDGTLQDPEARGEFVSSLGEPLKRAIADPTLLRGLRTEAMFESLVVSLGQIELMKKEDTGPAWTRRRGLRIPDYRIVLPDDTGFLVEVKHFHQRGEPNKAFPISRSYLAGLRHYEQLVRCPVKHDGRASLSMERAFKANEMGILGDIHVGTRFPLRFRLVVDPARERTLSRDGHAAFTIGGVELYCHDRRLTGKREWKIAMWFMLYGAWEEKVVPARLNGEFVGVDYIRMPPEDHGQGFEFIGTLSSLFSSMYLSSTSDTDRVSRLGIKVTSGSLVSLIPDDYDSDEFPLWRLHVMPENLRAPTAPD